MGGVLRAFARANVDHLKVKHYAMKTYMEVRHIGPHTFNLSTRLRSITNFMPWLLYPWYRLHRKLGIPRSWCVTVNMRKVCLHQGLMLILPMYCPHQTIVTQAFA